MDAAPKRGPAKFPLGRLVATPGALELIQGEGREPMEFVERHSKGDWGDLYEHDRLVNENALIHGGRLLSSYIVAGDERVWLITESDRSSTCLLLPSEY
jgi:hypothetical protein